MDMLSIMQERYTTKEYDAQKKLTAEQTDALMECLRLSPSSINSQPWGFRLIEDGEQKERLASLSYFNAEKVRNCSHLLVFAVYKDAESFAQERLPEMDQRTQDYFRQSVLPLGDDHVVGWMSRQVYIALGILFATAASMGIDSTAMEGIDAAAYTEELGLQKHKVLFAVALGCRAESDANQPSQTPKRRRTDVLV